MQAGFPGIGMEGGLYGGWGAECGRMKWEETSGFEQVRQVSVVEEAVGS